MPAGAWLILSIEKFKSRLGCLLYAKFSVILIPTRWSKTLFGWLTKVYVWKRSGPSNVILHRFCLTKGSTLNSQESHPRSVVYVSKPTRAIWRYLLSEFCALLCLSSAQWQLNGTEKGKQTCQFLCCSLNLNFIHAIWISCHSL